MIKNLKTRFSELQQSELFRRVFKNSSWLMLQNVFTMLTGLFVTAIVARYFGPTNYGIFNYALSITSLFVGIATVGMNHIAIKDLTQTPEEHSKIMGTLLALRLVFAIILFTICQFVLFILCGDDKLTIIIGTILSSCIFFNVFDIITYYTQVTLNSRLESTSKIISSIVLSILKVLVVVFKFDLKVYALCYVIEALIYGIILFKKYKKLTKNKEINRWNFNKKYAKKLLSSSWYFALSAIMVTIYLRIDQVLIGRMIADKAQLGIYSAAVRVTDLWVFIPLAFIASYRPIILEKKKHSEEDFYKNLQRLYYVISIICFVFLIFMLIFSKIIILILYGNEFITAVDPLKILIFGTWFGVLGNVHYIWLACDNNQKYSLIYSVFGAASNIVLDIILIPKYGIMGAAVATLISQILANIVSFTVFKKTRILSKMILKSIFFIRYFTLKGERIK